MVCAGERQSKRGRENLRQKGNAIEEGVWEGKR